MKAILEFDLDDPSDRNSHKRAISADNAYIALHEIDNMLREYVKYGKGISSGSSYALPDGYHTITEQESILLHQFADEIRIKMARLLKENGVNMGYLE